MRTKNKTSLLVLLLVIVLCILWIYFDKSNIHLAFIIISICVFFIYKIFQTRHRIKHKLDKEKEAKPEYDDSAVRELRRFKLYVSKNYVSLEKMKKRQNSENIVKLDILNEYFIVDGILPGNYKFSSINYVALVCTRTLKTNKNIISIYLRTKKGLTTVYTYVIMNEGATDDIKQFFLNYLAIISYKTSLKVKYVDK